VRIGSVGPAESDLVSTLEAAVGELLSAPERRVVVALAVHGVPIDVLAQRLNTTRGELYDTLRDARGKLRRAPGLRGLTAD
jgi:RNA polymerase sigma-70 factor (ECF subfamily)